MEERRFIPWYEGKYQINNAWEIKSISREKKVKWWWVQYVKEKVLLQYVNSCWYKQVCLCRNAKVRSFFVHRLVAQSFLWLDISIKSLFVCHKDDNPSNNNLYNLFIGTSSDNTQDMLKKWRWVDNRWERHWLCKLTDKEIEDIRLLPRKWYKVIAQKYWISRGHVSRIKNKLWYRNI